MDWMSLVKTIAPWIGTALGGPLGGMAVEAAARALGASDKTADAVKQALGGATPEQMLALKEADQQFALQMQALGFKQVADLEAIAAGDRDSARKMQIATPSRMPAALTSGILASFAGVLVVLFLVPTPVENRDLIIYMVGQLSGFAGSATAYWLGTTRNNGRMTELLAQAGPVTK